MPTTYTPTATWHDDHSLIAGSDSPSAALINTPNESLADNCAFLEAQTFPSAAGNRKIVLPFNSYPRLNSAGRFSLSTSLVSWSQTSVASAGDIAFQFALPHVGALNRFEVSIKPAAGHGAVPATYPAIELFYMESTSGNTLVSVGTGADSGHTVGSYEAVHSIIIAGLSATPVALADDRIWTLVFTGETGANSLIGLQLLSMRYQVEPL
jgi:hypothetical protein